MNNTAPFTKADVVACFGSAAQHLPHNLSVSGVCTDTRTLVPGNAFIALQGERFDGHQHIAEAIRKGASLIVAEAKAVQGKPTNSAPFVFVESTVHALGTLAWYHRKRFSIPVVAIGGAAGKTSTKDLAAHVLSERFTVLKTEANFNNQIGTPLTLLALTSEHTAAVVEIGTNQPGEIELLSAMVQPTHGLITQIGKEHLEQLISLDGVEQEEMALFEFLIDTGGTMLINADDERIVRWCSQRSGKGLSFGVEHDADIHARVTFDHKLHPTIHVVLPDTALRATMHTFGYAAALNAVATVAVARVLGLSAHEIKHGLEGYLPNEPHGYARMVTESANGLVVLNDTYNANPDSMAVALRTLSAYPAEQRIAVLGDMRELGQRTAEEHIAILELALASADTVVVYGHEFSSAVRYLNKNVHVCDSHKQCALVVLAEAKPGAAVLVKGSRGLEMEHVITYLKEH